MNKDQKGFDSMKRKLMKKCVITGAIMAGFIVAGYTASQVYAGEQKQDTILDNIYIGEVAVGGMTADEADQAVRDYVEKLNEEPFILTVDSKKIVAGAGELGAVWENTQIVEEAVSIGKAGSLITRYKDKKDLEHEPKTLELSFTVEEATVKSYLEAHAEEINQEAKDGSIMRQDGAFAISEGKAGIELNIEESAKNITEYIQTEWDTSRQATVALVADTVQPRGTKEDLLKVKDVLGTFSTDYSSSSAGRATNVSNGCSRINGTLLYPGEEFSVYEAVSPFTAENGYALAGSYENGTVVETYGGGICQVSTTLYNAVIRAELEVKERYAHSMLVSYVKPSMDAAIAGTYKDFKFVNSSDSPVYIEGVTSGGIITFTIYGEETREAGREVSFESELVSETTPGTELRGSSEYAVGYVSTQQSAHIGKVARLWKVVTVDGVEQSREVFNNSTYNASPKIIVVGTKTSSAAASQIIQSAIASQNESAIYSAAANAAAVASQAAAPAQEDTQEVAKVQEEEADPASQEETAAKADNADAQEDSAKAADENTKPKKEKASDEKQEAAAEAEEEEPSEEAE